LPERHDVRLKVVVVTLIAMAAGSVQLPSRVVAQAQGCEQHSDWGECGVEIPVPVGISEPVSDTGGDGGAVGSAGPTVSPPCPWVTPTGANAQEGLRELFPEAPPDAVFQVQDCADANPDSPGGTQFSFGARWLPAAAAPEPVPPPSIAVALILYARVQAQMEAPVLATNPPAGASAVVDLPVFVEVTNWQGPITDGECVLGVCADLTAVPSLEFDAGEPEASLVTCDPPGSRFDLARGTAVAQASVPGACAYSYRERTGVAGRPGEWPGVVTVRWAVSWTSNVGDPPASGTFPDLTFSTASPRVVDEVQTVVTDDS
jgi:hypothetical protein